MLSNKYIKITLKKERYAIFLYVSMCLFINLFYFLLNNSEFYIYPIMLGMFFLSVYLICRYFTYKNLYLYLDESKTSPFYEGGRNSEFEDIFEEINSIHNNYISEIYDITNKEKEKEKLFIEWIHNMKTSVSVISLALEKLPYKEEPVNDIKIENELLEKNLEGALNIFRLNDFSKDYIIESLNLMLLVKEAINSQKRNFIYSNVFPQVKIPKDYFILSDKKWSKYVIIQIISNAIKYSEKGSKIIFYAEKQDNKIKLFIKDAGMGIKSEEIKRIFDPFFTGTNGRKCEKSTGMGLYMCKNICKSLKHNIEVQSTEGEGTVVSITYMEFDNLTSV